MDKHARREIERRHGLAKATADTFRRLDESSAQRWYHEGLSAGLEIALAIVDDVARVECPRCHAHTSYHRTALRPTNCHNCATVVCGAEWITP